MRNLSQREIDRMFDRSRARAATLRDEANARQARYALSCACVAAGLLLLTLGILALLTLPY